MVIEYKLVARDPLFVFLPSDHRLAGHKAIDPHDLVGERFMRRRHGKAEHPGGPGVDDQPKLRRLHDWQVGGLRALDDVARVGTGLAVGIRIVGSVAHQSADFGVLTQIMG